MRINNTKEPMNFKSLSLMKTSLNAFHNANATIPTLLIESGVTLGRSYEANKRGGKIEATERFVEQGVGAFVWLYGVQTLRKIGDFFGKHVLGFKNLNFDVGRDVLRNPIKNNKIQKNVATFKATNAILSTAFATLFIGFLLPKINHLITNKAMKKNQNQKNDFKNTTLKKVSMNDFKNNLKDKKQISFTSLSDSVVSIAHTLENNSHARLFVTDTGVIAGRFKNGRNKYERLEGLFRDISSIYFYLLSTKHIVKGLNKITKNRDINPTIIESTLSMLKKNFDEKEIKLDDFIQLVTGKTDETQLKKLDELFKDKEIINVEEFIKTFDMKEKALKMAQLQPIFEGNGVLSKMQAKDVLNDGLISNPEFLKEAMNKATKGASDDKLKFVSKKHLENLRTQIDDFVDFVVKNAKDKKTIDISEIQKIAKRNMNKNFVFYSLGTAFSAFALGILIPKVQYFITKKITKDDSFPGVKEYK